MNTPPPKAPLSADSLSHDKEKPIFYIDEIADGASLGCYYQDQALLAVRQGNDIFIYHNSCPHLGIPLEWQEHQFLNHDRSLIQCNTHGALFTIEDGECISGPCGGDYLKSVAIDIKDGAVFVRTNDSL